MQKTRLGISVGALGALVYLTGLFSGYMICIILAGYVLLFEENGWLRRSAVKAIALLVFFSLITSILNLIPEAIGVIDDIANIFNQDFSIEFLTRIITAIVSIISFIKIILFIILGIKALNQGTVVIPFLDKMINKFI